MTAVRSRKYIDGSRGQPCVLCIAGVCTGGGDDTVFAHIRDRHAGRSIKASDLSGGDACFACHEVFDRRAKMPNGELISDADWLFYALRALQGTIERRVDQGLLFVSQDIVERFDERATKSRKPPAERQPIHNRAQWPEGRKIQQRPKLGRRNSTTHNAEHEDQTS